MCLLLQINKAAFFIMKRFNLLYSSFFLIVFYLLITQLAMAASPDKKIQTVVNLLDYIARDYVGAVENGKIISETEYAEMIDFGASVYTLSSETAFKQQQAKEPILSQIKQLQKRIVDKADITEIDSLARKVRSEIITATGFDPLPAHYPSLVAGQALFKTYCVSCHGEHGDGKGPAAKGLDPEPTNFLDAKAMQPVSPLAAFNTISIGLQGTAMTGFSEVLDENQIWELAFYLKSLSARQAGLDSAKADQILHSMKERIPLETIAASSDNELIKILSGSPAERQQKIAALRMQNPPNGPNAYIEQAKGSLQQALMAYEQQNRKEARQLTLTAYLEGIEPIEAQLTATAPHLTIAIEEQMLLIRKLIESGVPTDQLRGEINKTSALIDDASNVLGDKKFEFEVLVTNGRKIAV
ncbi:c-type cytochrome [Dyadobacter bucti]|uniref:c-type cytochrome n=1 Tax=Dyadobacter bucti TaxID=2572203 RepID=UPI001108B6D6|nr:cytochrome c [Dyadobacter bucti]